MNEDERKRKVDRSWFKGLPQDFLWRHLNNSMSTSVGQSPFHPKGAATVTATYFVCVCVCVFLYTLTHFAEISTPLFQPEKPNFLSGTSCSSLPPQTLPQSRCPRRRLLRCQLAFRCGIISLTLSPLMSYIYGAPCKVRNFNVVYIWTYVWQR
jgi:hypothetical protein